MDLQLYESINVEVTYRDDIRQFQVLVNGDEACKLNLRSRRDNAASQYKVPLGIKTITSLSCNRSGQQDQDQLELKGHFRFFRYFRLLVWRTPFQQ